MVFIDNVEAWADELSGEMPAFLSRRDVVCIVRAAIDALPNDGGSDLDVEILRSAYVEKREKHLSLALGLGVSYSTFRRRLGVAIAHLRNTLGRRLAARDVDDPLRERT